MVEQFALHFLSGFVPVILIVVGITAGAYVGFSFVGSVLGFGWKEPAAPGLLPLLAQLMGMIAALLPGLFLFVVKVSDIAKGN